MSQTDPAAAGCIRLISFLGTNPYETTTYTHPDGRGLETCFVAHAIAHLWGAGEVVVLATEQAKEKNGIRLSWALGELPNGPRVRFQPIPEGRSEEELWEQFQILGEVMKPEGTLLLDITHGFRSQPFFAAGALTYLRMAGLLGDREISVLYGRFLPNEPARSPIWDLTPVIDVIDWAQGAAVLVETGHAGPLLDIARRTDRNLRRRLAMAGARTFPPSERLVGAIESFSDDLATLRIASLITGYDQQGGPCTGSAWRLKHAVDEYAEQVKQFMPGLTPILGRIGELAADLSAESLAQAGGKASLQRLCQRYLGFERYPEAAVVLREALISGYADRPEAIEITRNFDEDARRRAEECWARSDPQARAIADLRNDIEHGGFRCQPKPAATIRRELERLVTEWPDPIALASPPPSRCYVLDQAVITAWGDFRCTGPIAPDEARARIADGFISAIGDPGTAALLSAILQLPIPANPGAVAMEPGDRALVFTVKGALPEGPGEALADIPCELGWLERLR